MDIIDRKNFFVIIYLTGSERVQHTPDRWQNGFMKIAL